MKKILLIIFCLSVVGCFEKSFEKKVVWPENNKVVAKQGKYTLNEPTWNALKSEYNLKKGFALSSVAKNGFLIEKVNEQNFSHAIRKEALFDSILKIQGSSRIEDAMAKFVSREIIKDYYGQSPEELLAWIGAHPEVGCTELNKTCLKKVANERIDSVYDVQSFFKKNQYKWRKKQQYKIAWIRFTEETIFDTLELKLSQGVSFASLADRYSNERESGSKGGDLGFYFKGVNPGPLQAFVRQLNTKLVDKGKVQSGTLIKLNYQDKIYALLKVIEYIPHQLPKFDDVSEYAKKELHKMVVKELNEQMFEKLMTQYKIKYVYPIPKEKSKEFYNLNKQFFLEKSRVSVSINGKEKGRVKCLNGDFFNLPLRVRQGMSWPCGLGKNEKSVKTLLNQKTSQLNKMEYSWKMTPISSKTSEKPKSFRRLESFIRVILKESYIAYEDTTSLVKSNLKTWLTWGELRQLINSSSPKRRKGVKRHEWIESILKRKLYSKFLKESSWINSPSWLAQNEIILNKLALQYSKIPKESVSDSIKKMIFYKRYAKQFANLPYHPLRVVSLYNLVPELIWKRLAYKNDVDWIDVSEMNKADWFKQVYQFMDEATLAKQILKRNNGEKIIVDGLDLLGSYPSTLDETFDLGIKLFENKKGVEQMALYTWAEKAFYDSPNLDSLLFVKAKSFLDRNQSKKSVQKLKELRVILESGKLHSNVLFMLGWVIVEKLKKPKDALVYFKELIVKYPNSDLVDDADFMVKDIQSDGRYSKELMNKLGLSNVENK